MNIELKKMEGMQLVKVDYSTSDIITAIQKCDALFRSDMASIAKTLRRRSHRETVRAVFDYLLANVRYKLDKQGVQLARRPKRTISEKEGDCKSFSLLAGSLLYNLGYDYSYRFASYRTDPTPTHVYVIAHAPSGDIIVDGVLKKFDQEKKPITNQIDKRMKGLYIGSIGAVSQRRTSSAAINGLDTLPINGVGKVKSKKILKKVTSSVKKVATKARTSVKRVATKAKVVKKAGAKIKTVAKKGFAVVKKGALSPARNAFLLLVKTNFRGMASKLAVADQAKLRAKWEKLGGSYASLKKTVDSAKNKKRIMGIGATVYTPLGAIGATQEPVKLDSILAVAAPFLELLKMFLPKGSSDGVDPEAKAQSQELAQSIENGTATVEQLERSESTVRTRSGRSVQLPDEENFQNELVETSATQRGGSSVKRSSANNGDEETSSESGSESGMSNTTKIALGVAAAGAMFLVMKKK